MNPDLFFDTYRLHDLCIRTQSDNEHIREALSEILVYKGATKTADEAPHDFVLDIRSSRRSPSLPSSARKVGQGEAGVQLWQAGRTAYVRHSESVAELSPDSGTARATVCPATMRDRDGSRLALFYFITMSFVILLRQRNYFALHAAALSRDGVGVLLVAQSDSGKSTAALNLVRQGWHHLSDDTVLLSSNGGVVEARSFRRPFCIDADAVRRFPELIGRDWPSPMSDGKKRRIDVASVYPGQFTAACVPTVLVVPRIVDAPSSEIVPMAHRDMLEHLIVQSALFTSADPQIAQRHLDTLGRLIAQTATYRLRAGRDLLDDAARIDRLLTPLVEDAATGTSRSAADG